MMQNVIKSYKQTILSKSYFSMPFPENDIWKMLLGIGYLQSWDLSPKNLEDPLKLK